MVQVALWGLLILAAAGLLAAAIFMMARVLTMILFIVAFLYLLYLVMKWVFRGG